MAWTESSESLGYYPPIHQPSHVPNTDFLFMLVAGTAVGHSTNEPKEMLFLCTAQQTVHGTGTLTEGFGS